MKSQLFKKLAEQIYTDYADVRKLPGERRLGERYVASRATIRAALQELQNGGRLVSDPRRGHTLIPAAPSREERTGNVVPPPERRSPLRADDSGRARQGFAAVSPGKDRRRRRSRRSWRSQPL